MKSVIFTTSLWYQEFLHQPSDTNIYHLGEFSLKRFNRIKVITKSVSPMVFRIYLKLLWPLILEYVIMIVKMLGSLTVERYDVFVTVRSVIVEGSVPVVHWSSVMCVQVRRHGGGGGGGGGWYQTCPPPHDFPFFFFLSREGTMKRGSVRVCVRPCVRACVRASTKNATSPLFLGRF